MKLFDSATQQLQEVKGNSVSLYTCGPTVYNNATLGNWRTFLVDDLLYRALLASGHQVDWALNYTDVGHLVSDADSGEDKMQRQAEIEHTKSEVIASRNIDLFEEGMRQLNINRPGHVMRATAMIPEMISFIQGLEKLGYTYATTDGIYFDTAKFKTYGQLARADLAGQQAGVRVEENKEKRHAADFALWKFSPQDSKRDMEWDSPWGVGFPGWHIECSAMANKVFGSTVDIHTGGIDLLPTHHQNELAQSEALNGETFVHIWVHIEHLLVGGKRMGKSEGNAYTLTDLKARGFDPLDFRYLTLMTHYRQKQNFTWEALTAAKQARARLVNKALAPDEGQVQQDLIAELTSIVANDLDYPRALARLHSYIKEDQSGQAATITTASETLFGILPADIKQRLAGSEVPERVQLLLQDRNESRAAGEFQRADQLRQIINEAGYDIIDGQSGSTLIKK